ncbi:hypothetical protein JIN77_14110 [Verrucomicrobiaceae bacterium R5-34]|nr:hypothetical protein [Verrucomicrobiaceae bacterium R5-34]
MPTETVAEPTAATAPSLEDIRYTAYLNYKTREQEGIYGDELGDWYHAEARLSQTSV